MGKWSFVMILALLSVTATALDKAFAQLVNAVDKDLREVLEMKNELYDKADAQKIFAKRFEYLYIEGTKKLLEKVDEILGCDDGVFDLFLKKDSLTSLEKQRARRELDRAHHWYHAANRLIEDGESERNNTIVWLFGNDFSNVIEAVRHAKKRLALAETIVGLFHDVASGESYDDDFLWAEVFYEIAAQKGNSEAKNLLGILRKRLCKELVESSDTQGVTPVCLKNLFLASDSCDENDIWENDQEEAGSSNASATADAIAENSNTHSDTESAECVDIRSATPLHLKKLFLANDSWDEFDSCERDQQGAACSDTNTTYHNACSG